MEVCRVLGDSGEENKILEKWG